MVELKGNVDLLVLFVFEVKVVFSMFKDKRFVKINGLY